MMTIGIDPGLGGALALMDESASVVDLRDMPTLKATKSRRVLDLSEILAWIGLCRFRKGDCRVVIERAIVMPKQGSSSGFKIGIGYGQLLGVLAALRLPTMVVGPQQWQKAILGAGEAGTSKDRARDFAQRMFPAADLGKKKSQDRADALLLALYGVRHWSSAPSLDLTGEIGA